MTGFGVLFLTVLFHRKGHPDLNLKSNSNSSVIHPFLLPLYFIFFPGVMRQGVYVEMKGKALG